MSDTYSSGEGCADSVTSSAPPPAGYESAQAVQWGSAQPFPQASSPQNGSGAMSQDVNGLYAAPVTEEHSCGGETVSAVPTGGSPVAGQPVEVAGQWHDAFHLKPANGYAYAGEQVTPFVQSVTYGQPIAYGQPITYGQPTSFVQTASAPHESASPMPGYPITGSTASAPAVSAPSATAPTDAPQAPQGFASPQAPSPYAQAPAYAAAPVYTQPMQGAMPNPYAQQPMYGAQPAFMGMNAMPVPPMGYPATPGMVLGGVTGMMPPPQVMAGYAPIPPAPPIPQGYQAPYAPPIPQAPQAPQGTQGPQASQGPQVFAQPASESAGGQGHCKGNCSHHKGGEATGATNFAENMNPFAFLSSLGGMAGMGGAGSFDGLGSLGEAFGSLAGSLAGFPAGQQVGQQTGPDDPQHLEMKYGQLLEIYNDVMQGKTDPAKIISFLSSTGTYFWKGAVVGAVLTMLFTNDAVKSTLKECLSGIMPSKS